MKKMKKIYICGEVVNTKNMSQYGFEAYLQNRYDKWLGKDKVTVKVNEFTPERIAITIFRKYGDWYKDPSNYSHTPGDVSMLDWDRQILFGDGYFEGGEADFEKHESRYIITRSIENIIDGYKELAKEKHCNRIKSLEYTEALDHFDFAFVF